MKNQLRSGCYPVMLTPFFEDMTVDYEGLQNFTKWFAKQGCQGLFAVCGSSEMTALSLKERVKIARTVVDTVKGLDIDVVASGHVSPVIEEQIEEIQAISDTGIDSFVLVTSRIAHPYQDDRIFLKNLEHILSATEGITFGVYECPSPYNRQLTPEIVKYMAQTGRFTFSKDTSCSYAIREKIKAASGSNFKFFNAYSPLCLDSMKAGGQGYCGIHANFYPDLFVKLWELFTAGNMEKAEELQSFLTILGEASMPYNVGTKYYLNTFEGVSMGDYSRNSNVRLSDLEKEKLRQYYWAISQVREKFASI